MLGGLATARMGVVSSYDAENYAAKVRLQPEDSETGWLPVATIWSGPGWGVFCPPTPGDVVDVHFQEGGREAGYVSLRHYGDALRPLPAPSGEFWLVHKTGSRLKFLNDGSVELAANGNLTLSAGATLRLEAAAIQVHATDGYRFDVNGHGQSWTPDRVNTCQAGEVAGDANPISPPEIGD